MNADRATSRRRIGAALFLVLLCLIGAALWYFLRPVSRLTLERIGFESIPGWDTGEKGAALAAFRRSCSRVLREAPAAPMGGTGYGGAVRDWQAVCQAADAVAANQDARRWFETWFVPFAVNGTPDALFTGYYEPEIRASRIEHGAYVTPVYGLPSDLVVADLGLFRSTLAGLRVTGRVEDHRLVPFPSRAAIDANRLADSPVLLYANDPVALFFLHIQGSGRALLDDGTMMRIAYAGQNGRAYTPIGRTLLDRGEIDRAHLSMQAIRSWLKSHPRAARGVMETDESFVFFRELPVGDSALGSPGTEGVPLTPETSIAVDPEIHPLGAPMFVEARSKFARLCIAQDTGGAIKGALRADIFWGFGARAEDIAGHLAATGRLYVLLPKSLAARIGARYEAPQ